MPPSEQYAPLLLCLAAVTGIAAADSPLEPRRFPVQSEPSGAEVRVIGGRLGTTPLTLNERDIYPNDFPDERLDDYGVVILSHPGCETLRHRVTREEIEQGLKLRLECRQSIAAAPPAAATPSARAAETAGQTAESKADRRLRQLRVLDELLEEGLLSPEEERRIRRRILSAP